MTNNNNKNNKSINNKNINIFNNNKTLYSRIIFGIKSGWNLPILPDHIIRLNQNIYVKLLRFLGPLSVFIMISGFCKQFDDIIYYTIFVISLVYILYRYMIAFYAIKQ